MNHLIQIVFVVALIPYKDAARILFRNAGCDQVNCWTTSGGKDQPEFPCRIDIWNNWCDFRNDEFPSVRIPPNGTSFEITTLYEDSNHDCVTRPALNISLPPDPSTIGGLVLQVQVTSGTRVNYKECLTLNFTAPSFDADLPTNLHIDVPCFQTMPAFTEWEFTLKTFPFADTQSKAFQYRKRFEALQLEYDRRNPNKCVPFITTDPVTSPTGAPTESPKTAASTENNKGTDTVVIIVAVLSVGIVVLLAIAVAGALLARRYNGNSNDLETTGTVVRSTCPHHNTSASAICRCTVCEPSSSPCSSVASRSAILKPDSTTVMRSENGTFNDLYTFRGDLGIDSGHGDSISC